MQPCLRRGIGRQRAGQDRTPNAAPGEVVDEVEDLAEVAADTVESAQAACSARSLIPRSIFWVITKLTASAGSTMNRAHALV
jgi:hypothetical protein